MASDFLFWGSMPPVLKPSKKTKKKKLITIAALTRKADGVFSKFIRNRDNHTCVTCGKPAQHAGHYIRRGHRRARFNVRNVNAQCVYCNTFCYGAMDAYALFLINKYGIDILDELFALKGTYKYTREELEKIILAYS